MEKSKYEITGRTKRFMLVNGKSEIDYIQTHNVMANDINEMNEALNKKARIDTIMDHEKRTDVERKKIFDGLFLKWAKHSELEYDEWTKKNWGEY